MNETSFFINITNSKMIIKIGEKEVNIKNSGQERIHRMKIQWSAAEDTKLLDC